MTHEALALPADTSTHPWFRPLSLSTSSGLRPPERVARTPADTAGSSIKAFDAADEYLLHEFSRRNLELGTQVLVVNDRFGALASALADKYQVTTWGDSFLSFGSAAANLASNHIEPTDVTFLPSTSSPNSGDLRAPFAAILIRVPKSLSLLEHQLHEIRSVVEAQVPVICAGMEKHLSRRVNTLLDELIGAPTASLGWRKARLIVACAESEVINDRRESPFPSSYVLAEVKPTLTLFNYAGVFSRTGLDLGTRTMLPFLTHDLGVARNPDKSLQVADLGCGNGIIGIISARSNPEAEYTFFDESFLAMRSTEENWRAAFPGRPAKFVCGDAMADTPPDTFDVIFCNPPFHQDHAVGDESAWRMFLSAHRSLGPSGSLLVVGNRHLNYHHKLRRLFGRADQLGGSPKFVVLHAERT